MVGVGDTFFLHIQQQQHSTKGNENIWGVFRVDSKCLRYHIFSFGSARFSFPFPVPAFLYCYSDTASLGPNKASFSKQKKRREENFLDPAPNFTVIFVSDDSVHGESVGR